MHTHAIVDIHVLVINIQSRFLTIVTTRPLPSSDEDSDDAEDTVAVGKKKAANKKVVNKANRKRMPKPAPGSGRGDFLNKGEEKAAKSTVIPKKPRK